MDFSALNVKQARDLGRNAAIAQERNDAAMVRHWRKQLGGLLLIATNKSEVQAAFDSAYRTYNGME